MWKEEGGKGLIGFSRNVFFIVERVGGYFFAQIVWGEGSVETHRPATERVHLDIFFFYFLFLLLKGKGGGGMEFFLGSLHWKCGRRRGERG